MASSRSYMSAADIARLRRDTQNFVDQHVGTGQPVKMSAIVKHILDLGWNLADRKMFAGWVSTNVTGHIDYQN